MELDGIIYANPDEDGEGTDSSHIDLHTGIAEDPECKDQAQCDDTNRKEAIPHVPEQQPDCDNHEHHCGKNEHAHRCGHLGLHLLLECRVAGKNNRYTGRPV